MTKLTISFTSEDVAKDFLLWLSDAGEQDYWDWMERQEEGRTGNITAINFKYDSERLNVTSTSGRVSEMPL